MASNKMLLQTYLGKQLLSVSKLKQICELFSLNINSELRFNYAVINAIDL